MVKFLHDTPADEDFFGPHSAIANAILDTVCVDQRLRIIGLSGTWGSGKSTVIRQLSKKLISDERFKNYVFFEYDAWLTQNDPPRRSFMEALIPFLIEKGVLDEAEWTHRLNILKGKVQETLKTTTPVLTWKSVVFLKTYLCAAIGLFILNKLEIKNFSAGTETTLDKWSLGTAFGLIALAPLAMIAVYIRERFIEKLPASKRSVVPRLLNKSIDTNRETTMRLLEPTSIEFRDEFRDIMMAVGAKKYRLIIVLDNVDRLSDEEALSLWSTMRSFFVDRLGQDFSVTNAPIVIVPVDIGSLTRVFADQKDGNERGKEIAQSYIDKTFDVLFDVREPAVSDWRSFYDRALTEAVGADFEFWEIHQSRRIYEAHELGKRRRTTPRAVIRLANAVAAIAATSKDVPLPTIVLYVLNKDSIAEGVTTWVTQKGRDFSEFDPEWKLNIAALYFMTDRNKAVGPLLKDDLQTAIIDEKPDAAATYLDMRGLGDVISEIAHDPPLDMDGTLRLGSLAAIAVILRDYGTKIHGSPMWLEDAQASLTKSFLRLDTSQSDISKLGSTLEYLCSLGSDARNLIGNGVKMIQSRLSAPRLDGAALNIISEALDAVHKLASEHEADSIAIHISGDTVLALTRQYAMYRRSKNWRCIVGPTNHSEIETVLANRLADPVTHSSVPDIIKMLSLNHDQKLIVSPEADDDTLLMSISEVMEKAEKKQFLASAAKAMVLLLAANPDLHSIAQGWADDGELTARFNEAVNEGDAPRVWALIVLGVASATYFAVTKPETWSSKFMAQDVLRQSVNSLASYPVPERIDLLWRAIRGWNALDTVLYALRNELIGTLSYQDLDTPALLLDYENTIIQAGRAPFLDLLLTDPKTEAPLAKLPPAALIRMIELPNIKPETKSKLAKALVERVHSASVDEWSAWISAGNNIFSRWTEIKTASPTRLGKRSHLAAALIQTVAACLDDRSVLARWRRAAELGTPTLIQAAQIALLREVASEPSATKAISVLKVLDVTDSTIQAQGNEWASFIARLIAHEDGREWIDAHAQSVKKLVKAFSGPATKTLREAVDALARDKREGRRLWAQKTKSDWFGKK